MKRALVIGIDDYPGAPLEGSVNDALAMSQLLESNGDGSPNFSVKTLVGDESPVTNAVISEAVANLFKTPADVALFYFAGHGILHPDTNVGYILGRDAKKGGWGMSLAEILGLANAARERIKSSVIILDSCHTAFAQEAAGLVGGDVTAIGTGVTILTATPPEGEAEDGEHGLFTEILIDGLQGGCADVRGRVSPASLYSHVDQTLCAWEQRPIYKANVREFIVLRQVAAKVPDDVLRKLPVLFPDRASEFALDPSYEEDRTNVPELDHIAVDPEHVRTFKELQNCNRHGLIVPVGTDHMYYAAIESKSCRLTALGAHYRKLAELKRL
jgi:hypothetical protein